MPLSSKLLERVLLRPPSTVICEAASCDHRCAVLLFWSCCSTPGDSVARSVSTRDCDGISRIWSCEITVPEVAAVVSISGTSAGDREFRGGGTDFQLRIDLLVVRSLQHDALAFDRFESGGGNREVVACGDQELDHPVALLIGFGGLFHVGLFGDYGNFGIGHRRALRVRHAATQRGTAGLCPQGTRAGERRHREHQNSISSLLLFSLEVTHRRTAGCGCRFD